MHGYDPPRRYACGWDRADPPDYAGPWTVQRGEVVPDGWFFDRCGEPVRVRARIPAMGLGAGALEAEVTLVYERLGECPGARGRTCAALRAIQKADRALLVTTSGFTRQGYDEARNQPVELWDGDILEEQITRADELRADPARARAVRRRRGAILYAGLLINCALVAYAFAAAGPPPLISPAEAVRAARQPTFTAAPAPPTTAPAAPTTALVVTPTMSETTIPTAAVFNGGNVRAAPDLQAVVLDQVNAGEQVELLGRSPDGLWLRVSNVRGQVGWTHRTLLTLEPAVEQGLPIVAP